MKNKLWTLRDIKKIIQKIGNQYGRIQIEKSWIEDGDYELYYSVGNVSNNSGTINLPKSNSSAKERKQTQKIYSYIRNSCTLPLLPSARKESAGWKLLNKEIDRLISKYGPDTLVDSHGDIIHNKEKENADSAPNGGTGAKESVEAESSDRESMPKSSPQLTISNVLSLKDSCDTRGSSKKEPKTPTQRIYNSPLSDIKNYYDVGSNKSSGGSSDRSQESDRRTTSGEAGGFKSQMAEEPRQTPSSRSPELKGQHSETCTSDSATKEQTLAEKTASISSWMRAVIINAVKAIEARKNEAEESKDVGSTSETNSNGKPNDSSEKMQVVTASGNDEAIEDDTAQQNDLLDSESSMGDSGSPSDQGPIKSDPPMPGVRSSTQSHGGIYATAEAMEEASKPLTREAQAIKKALDKVLDLLYVANGLEQSPRISPKKLVKELVSQSVRLSRTYREEQDKSNLLMLVDVSGSCSAVCGPLVATSLAILRVDPRVILINHSNGHPQEVHGHDRDKFLSVIGNKLPTSYQEIVGFWKKVASWPLAGIVAFGDWDAGEHYKVLTQQQRFIWIDGIPWQYRSYNSNWRTSDPIVASDELKKPAATWPKKPFAWWQGVKNARDAAFVLQKIAKEMTSLQKRQSRRKTS